MLELICLATYLLSFKYMSRIEKPQHTGKLIAVFLIIAMLCSPRFNKQQTIWSNMLLVNNFHCLSIIWTILLFHLFNCMNKHCPRWFHIPNTVTFFTVAIIHWIIVKFHEGSSVGRFGKMPNRSKFEKFSILVRLESLHERNSCIALPIVDQKIKQEVVLIFLNI